MLETQAYFTDIKEVISRQLEAAEKSIFVAVAWFTDKDLYRRNSSRVWFLNLYCTG